MFVDLAPPGRAVPWSYATSSPQYADSPFYVAEANVCVERGTAPIALLFWSLHPVALVGLLPLARRLNVVFISLMTSNQTSWCSAKPAHTPLVDSTVHTQHTHACAIIVDTIRSTTWWCIECRATFPPTHEVGFGHATLPPQVGQNLVDALSWIPH